MTDRSSGNDSPSRPAQTQPWAPDNINRSASSTMPAVRASNNLDVTSDPMNVQFLETKPLFTSIFSIFTLACGFQLGYIFSYTNTCIDCFNAKFGWDTAKQQDIYGAVIGSACSIAIVFGSIYTSFIIAHGRRRALNISAIIGIIGTIIQCFPYFPAILFGRLVYGFGVGISTVVFPRYMEEMIPSQMIGKFGGLYCLSFAFAQVVSYSLAAFLPPSTDTEGLKTTHAWQVIFAMPIVFYAIQLALNSFYIPYESPKFYVLNGEFEKARKIVGIIYEDKDTQKIVDYIDRHCERNTSNVTLSQAFTDRKYKKGTAVAIWTMVIHETTGFNVIMLYSSTIFASFGGEDGNSLDPRVGNYILGGWNFISACLSLYTAKAFSRRTLLVYGTFILFVCHTLVGIFTQLGMPIMSFVFILVFIFFMQTTSMAVSWLYCSEISTDIAMSYVSIIGFFSIFVLTIISPLLMDSVIQQQGTFWLFALFCLAGSIYFYVVIKETSHLDDKGKKQLYVPQDLRNSFSVDERDTNDGKAQLPSEESTSSNPNSGAAQKNFKYKESCKLLNDA